MFTILAWIALGLVAGYLGKMLHPGEEGGGWFMTMLLGILGAVVGGVITTLLGLGDVSGFNLWSIIVATGGAVLVLFLYYRFFAKTRA